MRRARHLELPNLPDKTCGRRRRELALIFALIFGAGLATAPLQARDVPFASQRVISNLANLARAVFAADVDGDGDLDVISASSSDDPIAWYENTDGKGAFGSQQVISTLADFALSVFSADVDGDGDLDVLSASKDDNTIAWYENTDSAGSFGTERVISTLADGARSVCAADVDGDGDVDVVSASGSDNTIAWYENTDGDGTFGSEQVVSTLADGATSAFSADVDGDGDLDVLSASSSDATIAWYENTDGGGAFGSQQVISNLANGALSVFAADIDGDGDVDVLSASSGFPSDDRIAWYENTDGGGAFGSQQVISTLAAGANSVFAADVDSDGDLDVLSASFLDAKIAWYENTDGNGSFAPERTVSTLANSAPSVFATDLDGDGDLDVLATFGSGRSTAWYENRGGQFALPTTPRAQGVLANSQEQVLFQIDLEHRGRAGDSAVELASLELLFEDGAGTLLSSAQTNALIEKLEVFLDDGSGGFEPGADTLVEQVGALAVAAGVQSIPFASGDPEAQVAFGSSKRYFAVVTLTSDAGAQDPGSFEAIHLTEATSTGRDASTVCEAATVLTASHGLEVVSPGDLTMRAGERVVLGVDFSVGPGGKLNTEIDPALRP